MAAAEHKLSRRALLGAALVAPIAAAARPLCPPAAVSQGDSFAVTKWDRALERFQRAEVALAALEGGPDEDAYGRAHDRFNLALRRLLAVPAPDIAALATKLETAVAAELADLTYAPPGLAALAMDARRLASLRSS
jgi:hypothetical protein